MKFKKTIALVVLLTSVAAFAYELKCPIDNSSMYFTGQTKTVQGTLLKLYRCPQGHESWSKD